MYLTYFSTWLIFSFGKQFHAKAAYVNPGRCCIDTVKRMTQTHSNIQCHYLFCIIGTLTKPCKLDGAKQYQPPSLLPVGSDKAEHCHLSFLTCIWMVCLELEECKTGCMVGNLMYADDLIIMSPYSAGLQQLLRVCTKYGLQFDIKFNPKKSFIMIARTKEDQKLKFPSFYLSEQELDIVTKIKYLRHIIRNDLSDDDHIQHQCYKWYAQANMLARKFHMCTDEVKTALFRAYCTLLYTTHLWCSHSKAKMNKIKVAYNDALRILFKYPGWKSASKMLIDSRNGIIISLTDPTQSETRYFSSFWKYSNQHVYIF